MNWGEWNGQWDFSFMGFRMGMKLVNAQVWLTRSGMEWNRNFTFGTLEHRKEWNENNKKVQIVLVFFLLKLIIIQFCANWINQIGLSSIKNLYLVPSFTLGIVARDLS